MKQEWIYVREVEELQLEARAEELQLSLLAIRAEVRATSHERTHVVDGPEPQPHLPVLVLTEDHLSDPRADLSPQDADV